MRMTIVASSFLVCVSLVCSPTTADVIHLRDGDPIEGQVTEYVDQHLRIELPDGKVVLRKVTEVERIQFDDSRASKGSEPAVPSPEIQKLLEEAIKEAKPSLEAKTRPTGGVAMYLDTKDPDARIPDNEVEYRCYSGGGYSGIRRSPLRKAFVQHESVRATGVVRIQLDPGPPYKIVNRHVTLKPGEFINLGRVMLEKQDYEGTASIIGTVRDSLGEPLSGVRVTANGRESVSDSSGRYFLDGFELEEVSIQAHARGYRGGTARVSIRDMEKREIKQDLAMFLPRKVKLRYVISAKDKSSFVGAGVEEGSIDLTVESLRGELSRYHHKSDSFRKFTADTRLNLRFDKGRLTLDCGMCPVFFQTSAGGIEFDEVESMGRVDINQQQCPPLTKGKFVLMRGFQDPPKGAPAGIPRRVISPYCVKVLVEDISIQHPEVEDE